MALAPRRVHALTKQELFTGRTGRVLRAVGQVPVHRTQVDPRAIKTAVRVLRDGGASRSSPKASAGTASSPRPGPARPTWRW